jgi:peptidyl-tRNA hydrolase, PTH1 family
VRLVVGLGNPGREYARTRHNIGFMVLDELARRWSLDGWKKKDGALTVLDRTRDVMLVEPQTYMNLSGEPTQRIAAFHKIQTHDIFVVVDDLDLPFAKLRLRERGSAGGHNGLKSLIAHFGEDFPRLRIGIGRDGTGDAIGRVLAPFSPEEEQQLPVIVDAAIDVIDAWISAGPTAAIHVLNGQRRAI